MRAMIMHGAQQQRISTKVVSAIPHTVYRYVWYRARLHVLCKMSDTRHNMVNLAASSQHYRFHNIARTKSPIT